MFALRDMDKPKWQKYNHSLIAILSIFIFTLFALYKLLKNMYDKA